MAIAIRDTESTEFSGVFLMEGWYKKVIVVELG